MKPLALLASFALLVPATQASAAPAVADASGDPLDPTVATLAAVVPTVIGGALLGTTLAMHDGTARDGLLLGGLATLTVGPSLGHYYAGATGRGLATTAIRAGGLAVFGGTWLLADRLDDEGEVGISVGAMVLIGGAVFAAQQFVATIVFDVVDAAPSARRHNRDLQIVPTVLSAAGGTAPGLALGGSF